jgi:8-oxo-dGTP diphosphatase
MRTAVGVAVIQNNRILLVRKQETWILPGGKSEKGESDIKCVRREASEELSGVGLKNLQFYETFGGLTPHTGDVLQVKVYLADVEGEVHPSREINVAEWTSNPEKYNLSDITSKIIDSLRKDKYF